jgi:site-specific DNA-methyltransferase (adenine-specific)
VKGASKRALVCTERDNWGTPRDLFARLDAVFHFNLDAAATKENALCDAYITAEQDALKTSWLAAGCASTRVYCNCPYSRGWKEAFCQRAIAQVYYRNPAFVVMLLPAATSDGFWTKWVTPHAAEIIFIEGRLRFAGAPSCADFPSAVVVYRPHIAGPAYGTMKATLGQKKEG